MHKFNRQKYLRKLKVRKYYKYIYLISVIVVSAMLLIYFTHSKFSVSQETEVIRTTVGDFIHGDVVVGAYINGEYSRSIPTKNSGYMADKVICDNDAIGIWNDEDWSLTTKNLTTRTKCNIYFKYITYDYDYTGNVQEFTAPVSGTYKLETWGAQGGSSIDNGKVLENNFYGGYSVGKIYLKKSSTLIIVVGGKGEDAVVKKTSAGGYNGGGYGDWDHSDDEACGGGGGATSIQNALIGDGQLKNYENNKANVLIVSGGSAGTGVTFRDNFNSYKFSNGGGFKGGASGFTGNNISDYQQIKSSTQSSGFKFGVGASATDITLSINQEIPGAGGGWYGGYIIDADSVTTLKFGMAGGGSGYIGNSFLKEKAMYCYNCEESSEESTKTISTTCSEEMPTENCAKKGNGYARIMLISIDE